VSLAGLKVFCAEIFTSTRSINPQLWRKIMLRKFTSLVLTALLFSTMVCVRSANADSKEEKQARFTQKVKAGISKLGVGENARVDVRLRDKTEVKGYVYQGQ